MMKAEWKMRTGAAHGGGATGTALPHQGRRVGHPADSVEGRKDEL